MILGCIHLTSKANHHRHWEFKSPNGSGLNHTEADFPFSITSKAEIYFRPETVTQSHEIPRDPVLVSLLSQCRTWSWLRKSHTYKSLAERYNRKLQAMQRHQRSQRGEEIWKNSQVPNNIPTSNVSLPFQCSTS